MRLFIIIKIIYILTFLTGFFLFWKQFSVSFERSSSSLEKKWVHIFLEVVWIVFLVFIFGYWFHLVLFLLLPLVISCVLMCIPRWQRIFYRKDLLNMFFFFGIYFLLICWIIRWVLSLWVLTDEQGFRHLVEFSGVDLILDIMTPKEVSAKFGLLHYAVIKLHSFIYFSFRLDIFGILFCSLNFLLICICIRLIVPISEYEPQIKLYLISLLMIFILLNMVFLAADIFTFFIAFECILIPMVLIISLWGSPNRRQANNYLIFYTSIGAVPMLFGVVYLWNQVGLLSFISFKSLAICRFSWNEQIWLWVAFFIAFAIKTPMVPFHIWLPKAHVDAPTTGSVILAGLLLKIGLFGFVRLLLPVFPVATEYFSPYVAICATIGVIYASLITIRQIDAKRIVAYSSIAHINMALVSLCSLNKLGIMASIFLILSHGLISSALFFLIGFLYHRFHQRVVTYFGGLAILIPIFTIFFFFFFVS